MIEPNEKLKILDEVFYLIDTHQEGGYWDFKREWHSDDGELLYDIICIKTTWRVLSSARYYFKLKRDHNVRTVDKHSKI